MTEILLTPRQIEDRYGVSFWKDNGKHTKWEIAETLRDGTPLYRKKPKRDAYEEAIAYVLAQGLPLKCACDTCQPQYAALRSEMAIAPPPCRAPLFSKYQ